MEMTAAKLRQWRMAPRLVALLIGILSASLGALLLWNAPLEPLTTADSIGYIQFIEIRTAGYPLFLKAVGVSYAVAAQIALFALSAALLGKALYVLTGRASLAVILVLASFANPELAKFHYSILTESLFISILLSFFAALVMAAASKHMWWLLVAAALAGVATMVRPSGISLLPPLLLLVFLLAGWRGWRQWLGYGVACIALFVTIAGAERLYAASVHGDRLASLAPRHLFAKAGLIDAPPIDRRGLSAFDNRLADILERDDAPVRELLRQARGQRFYPALLNDYEVCLQWACLDAALPNGLPEAQLGDRLRQVAMKRIRGNPGALVPLAMDEYVAAWTIGARTHPAAAPLYDKYVAALRPVPLEQPLALTGALTPTQPRSIARFAQPLFFALGWGTIAIILISIVALARRGDRRSLLLMALCAAITVQSSLVMTAALAVGYPRYSMALWPLIVVAFLLLFAWIWESMTGGQTHAD